MSELNMHGEPPAATLEGYALPEVDGRCSICKEHDKPTYRMRAGCQNCGTKVIALLTKGHEAHHLSAECPACGGRKWLLRGLVA